MVWDLNKREGIILFKNLYGDFKIKKPADYILIPLRVLYMIFTLVFVIFSILLAISTLSFGEDPFEGDICLSTRIFLHISAVSVSLMIYVLAINAIFGWMK